MVGEGFWTAPYESPSDVSFNNQRKGEEKMENAIISFLVRLLLLLFVLFAFFGAIMLLLDFLETPEARRRRLAREEVLKERERRRRISSFKRESGIIGRRRNR